MPKPNIPPQLRNDIVAAMDAALNSTDAVSVTRTKRQGSNYKIKVKYETDPREAFTIRVIKVS